MNSYDVIVVGVGAVGSATCYHLATTGRAAAAFDFLRIDRLLAVPGPRPPLL